MTLFHRNKHIPQLIPFLNTLKDNETLFVLAYENLDAFEYIAYFHSYKTSSSIFGKDSLHFFNKDAAYQPLTIKETDIMRVDPPSNGQPYGSIITYTTYNFFLTKSKPIIFNIVKRYLKAKYHSKGIDETTKINLIKIYQNIAQTIKKA